MEKKIPDCYRPDPPPKPDGPMVKVLIYLAGAAGGAAVGALALAFGYLYYMQQGTRSERRWASDMFWTDTPVAMKHRAILGAAMGLLVGLGFIHWVYQRLSNR
jgi:hypothetical protein